MGNIKNIPELNFGLSSTEWNEFELGKITLSYSGGTPQSGNPVYYGGDIPFIRSGEISSDLTSLHITQAALENSSAKLVEKGDILYALYGATSGEVSRSQIDGAINQAVMAIKPDEGFDFEFITQLLRKNKKKIINTFLQGGQGNLSGAIIKSLVFKFPEKTKQIQIGTFLKNLDDQITLKQRKLDKLVTLKKAMLEKMFPKEGAEEPEIRFKGFSGAWSTHGYKDVFSKLSSNTLSRADLNYEYGEAKNIHYGDVLIKFNEVLDVRGERLPFISVEGVFEKYKSSRLQNGDVVMADAAEDETVGKCSEVLGLVQEEKIIAGLHTIALRPQMQFAQGYLGYYLNHDAFHNQLLKLAQGTKVLSISHNALQSTSIKSPQNIEEQAAIVACFKKLDDLISLQKNEHTKLKQIKSSYLEKMFV